MKNIIILLFLICSTYAETVSYSDAWLKNQIAKEAVSQKIKLLEEDLIVIKRNISNAATYIKNVNVAKEQILKYSNMQKEDEYALKLWNTVHTIIIKEEQRLTKMAVDEYFKQADVELKLEK